MGIGIIAPRGVPQAVIVADVVAATIGKSGRMIFSFPADPMAISTVADGGEMVAVVAEPGPTDKKKPR